MYLTGFADEAAHGIDGQIRATSELGWTHIEARNVDGANIHDLPEDKFDEVAGKLADAGVRVNCFGSAIANWGKSVLEPIEGTLEVVERAIPRMQRLGTKLIRIMSYAVLEGRGPDDQLEEERFQRLRILHERFTDAGITPVHENCMNYGGMSWQHTLRLVENVPGLKLVYDTGNPIFSVDRSKPRPYPMQSSWEFYSHVKEHVAYVHVKDGLWDSEAERQTFTFPGEGEGDVARIIADLLASGYDGGFSIEPHLSVVHHESSITSPGEQMFRNYVEYGRKFERIIEQICK